MLKASNIPMPTRIPAIVWNEAKFKEYIQDPRGVVPGTKMIFAGIKNPQEINDLWAYVSQFKADGSKK